MSLYESPTASPSTLIVGPDGEVEFDPTLSPQENLRRLEAFFQAYFDAEVPASFKPVVTGSFFFLPGKSLFSLAVSRPDVTVVAADGRDSSTLAAVRKEVTLHGRPASALARIRDGGLDDSAAYMDGVVRQRLPSGCASNTCGARVRVISKSSIRQRIVLSAIVKLRKQLGVGAVFNMNSVYIVRKNAVTYLVLIPFSQSYL